MKHETENFDPLAWKYLDGEITEAEFSELQEALKQDQELRRRYQLLVEVHHGLDTLPAESDATRLDIDRGRQRTTRRESNRSVGIAILASLLVVIGLVLWNGGDQPLDVVLTASRDADWRGAELMEGDTATTRMMHLMSGAVALHFPGKTDVIIEGPAVFQVQDNRTVEISSGTITVHHEGRPGDFKLLTPVGKFTDLGTRFGVKVGNGVTDSVVMTEVYEGEVVFDDPEQESLSLMDGDAYAIVGNNEHRSVYSEIGGEQVQVTGTFELSDSEQRLKSTENLALGKPVSTPAYYNVPKHGQVFPAAALTDNRLNDSGSPWNWSFWLAPNGDAGEFTLDLLDVYDISRIELMNTRNRQYADRGIDTFEIEISEDGKTFRHLLDGTLERVEFHDANYFKFEVFSFDTVPARYVRFRGKSHFHRTGAHPSPGSGGLNEIRVFE
ncbi:MAG: discoidin domain-containing protein [Verrucomicrobiota bacterium]